MPARRSSPEGYKKARLLRREMTPHERMLWAVLRTDQLEASFRRQHAIGPYIVDFCCINKRLIVEVDGGQHIDQNGYDDERTAFLEKQGYKVLRFWNNEVSEHLDAVLEAIMMALDGN